MSICVKCVLCMFSQIGSRVCIKRSLSVVNDRLRGDEDVLGMRSNKDVRLVIGAEIIKHKLSKNKSTYLTLIVTLLRDIASIIWSNPP